MNAKEVRIQMQDVLELIKRNPDLISVPSDGVVRNAYIDNQLDAIVLVVLSKSYPETWSGMYRQYDSYRLPAKPSIVPAPRPVPAIMPPTPPVKPQ